MESYVAASAHLRGSSWLWPKAAFKRDVLRPQYPADLNDAVKHVNKPMPLLKSSGGRGERPRKPLDPAGRV